MKHNQKGAWHFGISNITCNCAKYRGGPYIEHCVYWAHPVSIVYSIKILAMEAGRWLM